MHGFAIQVARNMQVDELKKALQARRLSIAGQKDALLHRLLHAIRKDPPSPPRPAGRSRRSGTATREEPRVAVIFDDADLTDEDITPSFQQAAMGGVTSKAKREAAARMAAQRATSTANHEAARLAGVREEEERVAAAETARRVKRTDKAGVRGDHAEEPVSAVAAASKSRKAGKRGQAAKVVDEEQVEVVTTRADPRVERPSRLKAESGTAAKRGRSTSRDRSTFPAKARKARSEPARPPMSDSDREWVAKCARSRFELPADTSDDDEDEDDDNVAPLLEAPNKPQAGAKAGRHRGNKAVRGSSDDDSDVGAHVERKRAVGGKAKRRASEAACAKKTLRRETRRRDTTSRATVGGHPEDDEVEQSGNSFAPGFDETDETTRIKPWNNDGDECEHDHAGEADFVLRSVTTAMARLDDHDEDIRRDREVNSKRHNELVGLVSQLLDNRSGNHKDAPPGTWTTKPEPPLGREVRHEGSLSGVSGRVIIDAPNVARDAGDIHRELAKRLRNHGNPLSDAPSRNPEEHQIFMLGASVALTAQVLGHGRHGGSMGRTRLRKVDDERIRPGDVIAAGVGLRGNNRVYTDVLSSRSSDQIVEDGVFLYEVLEISGIRIEGGLLKLEFVGVEGGGHHPLVTGGPFPMATDLFVPRCSHLAVVDEECPTGRSLRRGGETSDDSDNDDEDDGHRRSSRDSRPHPHGHSSSSSSAAASGRQSSSSSGNMYSALGQGRGSSSSSHGHRAHNHGEYESGDDGGASSDDRDSIFSASTSGGKDTGGTKLKSIVDLRNSSEVCSFAVGHVLNQGEMEKTRVIRRMASETMQGVFFAVKGTITLDVQSTLKRIVRAINAKVGQNLPIGFNVSMTDEALRVHVRGMGPVLNTPCLVNPTVFEHLVVGNWEALQLDWFNPSPIDRATSSDRVVKVQLADSLKRVFCFMGGVFTPTLTEIANPLIDNILTGEASNEAFSSSFVETSVVNILKTVMEVVRSGASSPAAPLNLQGYCINLYRAMFKEHYVNRTYITLSLQQRHERVPPAAVHTAVRNPPSAPGSKAASNPTNDDRKVVFQRKSETIDTRRPSADQLHRSPTPPPRTAAVASPPGQQVCGRNFKHQLGLGPPCSRSQSECKHRHVDIASLQRSDCQRIVSAHMGVEKPWGETGYVATKNAVNELPRNKPTLGSRS